MKTHKITVYRHFYQHVTLEVEAPTRDDAFGILDQKICDGEDLAPDHQWSQPVFTNIDLDEDDDFEESED